jgi:hypothetical protein
MMQAGNREEIRPVTSVVAGSSPVVPANPFNTSAGFQPRSGPTMMREKREQKNEICWLRTGSSRGLMEATQASLRDNNARFSRLG